MIIAHQTREKMIDLLDFESDEIYLFQNEQTLKNYLSIANEHLGPVFIVTPLMFRTREIFNQLNKIEHCTKSLTYLYFPFSEIIKGKEHIYDIFLKNNVEKIKMINKKIIKRFSDNKHLIITFPGNCTLNLDVRGAFFQEDGEINKEEKVTQIPGGEIYTPLDYGCVNGKASYFKEDGTIEVLSFSNNFCEINGIQRIVCELGIGTNPDLPNLSSLDCYEKKLGTIHLGFGDNTTLEGDIRADYHFDLVFPIFCIKDEKGTVLYEKS